MTARSYSFGQARDFAREALDAAGADISLKAGIEIDLAFSEFSLGQIGSAIEHTSIALAYAEETGDSALKAVALACVTNAEFFGGLGVAEARMAEALALEDPSWVGPMEMRPTFIRGLMSLWTMNLGDAISTFSALRDRSAELGLDINIPWLCFFLTLACIWCGDVERAARYADEADGIAALTGEPIQRALGLTARALVDACDRPAEVVRQEAGQALSIFQETNLVPYTSWPLIALGSLELSMGEAPRVDGMLKPMADFLTTLPFADPILGICLPDAIEAEIALGDFDRATAYLGWLEAGSARLDRAWGLAASFRCRGLMAAARGDLESAIEWLDRAVAQHNRVAMPFERARTLLAKGEVHRRRKEKRLAIEALTGALEIFKSYRAIRWSGRAQRELARVGQRRKQNELTATEQLVADLAARGMTNRKVAEAAFISPKTVEANLARVYSKLGIRSRAQLARALDAMVKSKA